MKTDATCTRCGCTDSDPCPEGCSWIWVDYGTGEGVCSACSPLAGPGESPVDEDALLAELSADDYRELIEQGEL